MKCYRHSERDAIGLCKASNKGLCLECSHDTGNGLACAESCITEVEQINEVVDRSKQIYSIGSNPPAIPSGAMVYFMFAALFCGWGLYVYIDKGKFQGFPVAMGLGMLAIGIYVIYKNRKLRLNC